MAAAFGLLNPEIAKRLEKAEKDVGAGRIRKIKSPKDPM